MNNRRSHRRKLMVVLSVFAATTMVPTVAVTAEQKQSRVTVANHQDHIKKGMTVWEVERVFGMRGEDFPWVGDRALAWRTHDGALIAIYFDRNLCAEWIFVHPPPTWREKIQRFLCPAWFK